MAKTSFFVTCLFYLLGITNPLPFSTGVNSLAIKNGVELSKPIGCPAEFQRDVRASVLEQREELFYRPRQNISLECNGQVTEQELKVSLTNLQDLRGYEFVVYPENTRSCLVDGTWSSKPPVCTWIATGTAPTIDFVDIGFFEIHDCTTQCRTKTGAWTEVGLINRDYLTPLESRQISESRKILYVFPRHVYLSFIFVPQIRALMDLKVRVKERDVIHTFSTESQQLLSGHFDAFRRVNKSEGSAVTQLPVYTREILVEFTFNHTNPTVPDVGFFAIPEPGNSRRGVWYGDGCPEVPFIPLSKKIINRDGDQTNVTYTCDPGYLMMDPITQEPSDGVLRCLKSFEWEPYPFPVCQKVNFNKAQHYTLDTTENKSFQFENVTTAFVENSNYKIPKSTSTNNYSVEGAETEEEHQNPGRTYSLVYAEKINASTSHTNEYSFYLNTEESESSSFTVVESGSNFSTTNDNRWTFLLWGIALSVGAVIGILCGFLIYKFRQNIRLKSIAQAQEIERRHANFSGRCKAVSNGYLVPCSNENTIIFYKLSSDFGTQFKSEYNSLFAVTDLQPLSSQPHEYAIPVYETTSFRSDETKENSSNFYWEINDEAFSIGTSITTYRPLSEEYACDD